MAQDLPVLDITLNAGADLSSSQYCFVKMDTADNQVVLAGDGDKAIGVLQNKPKQNQAAIVRIYGISPVVVTTPGSAPAPGAVAASAANGVADTPESGDHIIGVMKHSPTGTGALGTIILLPGGKA